MSADDRVAVRELLYLMREAFEGAGIEETGESQALLTNLATVPEARWRATPPGSDRSIESIVLHLGSCKVMYDDYAFGGGTLFWDQPAVQPWQEGEAPMDEAIAWLRDAHARLVEHVTALADDDLDRPRRANWGEERPTRWLIAAMITHDAYHAGEINHLRSLMSGDDRWMFVRETEGERSPEAPARSGSTPPQPE
jgi:uncharacterized damage-inducible protein DinB